MNSTSAGTICGSFWRWDVPARSRVPRALGVSHPTVFRSVNRIEAGLGVRLFERARDGYALTAAGEEMTALARRVEVEVDVLERRLAGQDLRPSGTVRLTTTDTLAFGALPSLLAAFRAAHPGIVVEITVANEVFNLSKREADVAIRPSRDPPAPLVGRKLAEIAMAIYRPRGHRRVTLDDLAAHDWVTPDDSLSHLPLARWLAERRLDHRAVFRANSLLALRDAARAGLGLVILPCYVGDAEKGLARAASPLADLASELWLLTHPDLRRVARIRAVMEDVGRRLQQLRPLFAGQG